MSGPENKRSTPWWTGSSDLPSELERKATDRLGLLAGLIASFGVLETALSHGLKIATADVYPTPQDLWDLLGIAVLAATSVVAFFGLRSRRWTTRTRHGIGVVYLISIAYLLSLTDHADYFWQDEHELHGVPFLAVLIVVFPVLVPMRARHAVALGLTMAAMGPLSLLTLSATLDYQTPHLGALVSSFPLFIVFVAGALAWIVHQLGVKLKQAQQLGSYTVVEKIGEGGMGVVYRARHAMLRRPTAVKLLAPDHIGERALARFEKEVQLTATLTHPNTVTVFDYGRTPDGRFYYAMELLDGPNLSDVVALDGPQPAARVVHILDQVAGALAEAHGRNLIHRDIKPANIMLVRRGGRPDVAKVVDFGLVRELDQSDVALTQADAVTGTPQYLSPEAIKTPTKVGPPADIYALGAVGYFLLTGEHVFEGKTVIEVCSAHLFDEPVAPSVRLGGPVPEDLEALILRCLAKDVSQRPSTATALKRELAACSPVTPWTDDDARAWWDRYGATFSEAATPRHSSATGQTIDVDRARA